MSKKEERTNHGTGQRSKGTIKFGHLWLDDEGDLGTTVQSGVMLQAFDARHYHSLDINGVRKGWTTSRCPGTYQVICGTDLKPDDLGFLVYSEMGDIILKSPNNGSSINVFLPDPTGLPLKFGFAIRVFYN